MKSEHASSSNLPLRTHADEDQSAFPMNADDSGEYMILNDADASEVQEKNTENKETTKAEMHKTTKNAKMNLPKKHELSDAVKKFMKDHPKPGVADECETTLPLRTTQVLRSYVEHFSMSTPPSQKGREGCLRSPPGLGPN